jgi:hypothetical protein
MSDEEPRPVAFPAVGAKAPGAKGYRATEYGGTLREFLDSGEESALVSCDAISQHAMYMGLTHAAEDKFLPVKVSKRPDGVHLTRTVPKVDTPAPQPADGDEAQPAIEDAPQVEAAPQPQKASFVDRIRSWGAKR